MQWSTIVTSIGSHDDEQIVGVTAGIFVVHFFVSITNTKWLGRLSSIGAWFQIISIVIIVITLLIVAPEHQSAKFVFTQFVHPKELGVKSAVMLVILGLPYFQSILTGFEVGTHVVEEVRTAATSGPRAMVYTVYCTATVEIILLLAMTFCIQVPDNLLDQDTATGEPLSLSPLSILHLLVFHSVRKSRV